MGKAFVKCKDKSSLCWIPTQGVNVIADITTQVEETPEVKSRLKSGVLEKVSASDYARFHNSAKNGKAERLKVAIELFNDAVTQKDLKAAQDNFKKANANGLSASDKKRFEVRILNVKDALEAQKIQKERTAKAENLVQDAIEKEVFTMKNRFYMLGRKKLGREPEELIEWTAKNDRNIEELEKAIEEKKPAE